MRRRRAEKRITMPDPRFGSVLITKFINKMMIGGNKAKARSLLYKAIDIFAKKINAENPLEAFEQALENVKPILEVKSRRIGGATYQVPVEISPERRSSLAIFWVIDNGRSKVGYSFPDGLALELVDCHNNVGASVKKKDETHRMAEANKAFAHYKW